MSEARRKPFLFGLLALISSIVFWTLVCKILYPWMQYRGGMGFFKFLDYSYVIMLVPPVFAVVALVRKESKLMAIVGITISLLIYLWLLHLYSTNGWGG